MVTGPGFDVLKRVRLRQETINQPYDFEEENVLHQNFRLFYNDDPTIHLVYFDLASRAAEDTNGITSQKINHFDILFADPRNRFVLFLDAPSTQLADRFLCSSVLERCISVHLSGVILENEDVIASLGLVQHTIWLEAVLIRADLGPLTNHRDRKRTLFLQQCFFDDVQSVHTYMLSLLLNHSDFQTHLIVVGIAIISLMIHTTETFEAGKIELAQFRKFVRRNLQVTTQSSASPLTPIDFSFVSWQEATHNPRLVRCECGLQQCDTLSSSAHHHLFISQIELITEIFGWLIENWRGSVFLHFVNMYELSVARFDALQCTNLVIGTEGYTYPSYTRGVYAQAHDSSKNEFFAYFQLPRKACHLERLVVFGFVALTATHFVESLVNLELRQAIVHTAAVQFFPNIRRLALVDLRISLEEVNGFAKLQQLTIFPLSSDMHISVSSCPNLSMILTRNQSDVCLSPDPNQQIFHVHFSTDTMSPIPNVFHIHLDPKRLHEIVKDPRAGYYSPLDVGQFCIGYRPKTSSLSTLIARPFAHNYRLLRYALSCAQQLADQPSSQAKQFLLNNQSLYIGSLIYVNASRLGVNTI